MLAETRGPASVWIRFVHTEAKYSLQLIRINGLQRDDVSCSGLVLRLYRSPKTAAAGGAFADAFDSSNTANIGLSVFTSPSLNPP